MQFVFSLLRQQFDFPPAHLVGAPSDGGDGVSEDRQVQRSAGLTDLPMTERSFPLLLHLFLSFLSCPFALLAASSYCCFPLLIVQSLRCTLCDGADCRGPLSYPRSYVKQAYSEPSALDRLTAAQITTNCCMRCVSPPQQQAEGRSL